MSEWISVDERLPESGVVVAVVISGNNGFCTGWLDDDGNYWAVGNMELSWDFLFSFDSEINVTHWMPLSDPTESN